VIYAVNVPGNPKGQPRVKATMRGAHAGVYTPKTADGWKTQVAIAVRDLPRPSGPIAVELHFAFERPKSHFGKRSTLPSAPRYHTGKPDLDNAVKSTLDAMVDAGFLADDRIVVRLVATKVWGPKPGCLIEIEEVTT